MISVLKRIRKLEVLAEELTSGIKGIVVFGSYGSDYKQPTSRSDLDLAILCEDYVPIPKLDAKIIGALQPIHTDIAYYSETALNRLLFSKIDYFMLRNIFLEGKTIYSQKGSIELIKKSLRRIKPDLAGFKNTFLKKQGKRIPSLQGKLRNLHRILHDCLAMGYYEETRRILKTSELVDASKSSGIFIEEDLELYQRLGELRKWQERTMETIPLNKVNEFARQTYEWARKILACPEI